MFTIEERTALRAVLVDYARRDARISAAALTGSAAAKREDRWSDIDLAFAVEGAASLPDVLADFTAHMTRAHRAIDRVDVRAGSWVYHVFLLANTLQVDLAFVPATDFRALAPTFELLYGKANAPGEFPQPSARDLIGLAWLRALHARSAIARGHLWQTEYMIGAMRNHALALACLRCGLPAAHARGVDQLPESKCAPFAGSLVRSLEGAEPSRAFACAVTALLREIEAVDAALAVCLREPLLALVGVPCAS